MVIEAGSKPLLSAFGGPPRPAGFVDDRPGRSNGSGISESAQLVVRAVTSSREGGRVLRSTLRTYTG